MQSLYDKNIDFIIKCVTVSCFINNRDWIISNKSKFIEFFKFFYSLVNKRPLFMNYKFIFNRLHLFKVSLFKLNSINNFLRLLYKEVCDVYYNKNLNMIEFYKFNKFFDFYIFIDNNKLNFFSCKYDLKDCFYFKNIDFNINFRFRNNITSKFRIYYAVKNKFKVGLKK